MTAADNSTRKPTVEVLLESDWAAGSLVADVRRGLGTAPRSLPPKWLYDDHGSQLFDRITKLPEYYPFAREHEILTRHAADIAELSGATTLVELGSGTSEKTRMLLDAFDATGQLQRFCPVDVSEQTLRDAAAATKCGTARRMSSSRLPRDDGPASRPTRRVSAAERTRPYV